MKLNKRKVQELAAVAGIFMAVGLTGCSGANQAGNTATKEASWYIKNEIVKEQQEVKSISIAYTATEFDLKEGILKGEVGADGTVSKELTDSEDINKMMNYIDAMQVVAKESKSKPVSAKKKENLGDLDITIQFTDGSTLELTTANALGKDGREAVAYTENTSYYVSGNNAILKPITKRYMLK